MRIGGTALPVFDFDPYWVAILSVLPGLINLFLFFYSVVKLPRTRLTFGFNTFVLLLSLWQITESLGRTASTAAASEFFVNISLYILILVPIFGIRFLLRLTGRTAIKATSAFYVFYIAVPIVLGVILINRLCEFIITPSPIFNWTITPKATTGTMIYLGWIGMASFGMVIAAWVGYLFPRTKSVDPEKIRLIAWWVSVPIILGIVCEIMLPIMGGADNFPITNVAALSFSIASFYTIIRTDILRNVPNHELKYILDHMDEGLIILNNDFKIRYANKKASRLIECSKRTLGEYHVADHFADSGIKWNELILS
jgi:PAS domain-containing protein